MSELPPDYKLMMDAAQVGVEAIRAFNGEFNLRSTIFLIKSNLIYSLLLRICVYGWIFFSIAL